MISKDMSIATSSLASADGPTPSASPDGLLTGQCGPEAVPVSRFRALDNTRAMPTNATSGPLFSALSPSAALSASLASNLQARMDANGSPEYVLTWKHWDMPAGALICQLRASRRRTSGPDCIGWPTPRAADGPKNTRTYQGALNEAQRVGLSRSDLQTVLMLGVPPAETNMDTQAPLAGWPTPDAGAQNINDTTWQERQAKLREQYNNGNGFGMTLGMAVQIAGWGTPQARDWKEVGDQSNIPVNVYLPRQVQMADHVALPIAGWRTPDGMGGHHRGIPNSPEQMARRIQDGRQVMLADQAMLADQGMLAGWTTPGAMEPLHPNPRPSRAATGRRTEYLGRQVHGAITHGSGAPSQGPPLADTTGALNPQFSCWLMGFPQEWVSCADSATP